MLPSAPGKMPEKSIIAAAGGASLALSAMHGGRLDPKPQMGAQHGPQSGAASTSASQKRPSSVSKPARVPLTAAASPAFNWGPADNIVGLEPSPSSYTTSGFTHFLGGLGIAGFLAAAALRRRRQSMAVRASPAAKTSPEPLPEVDRSTTKAYRKELVRSEQYFRFSKTQMDKAMNELRNISGSSLLAKIREAGFRYTIGDVTFVLAESYGFCWGVERSVAMAYEARNFFPDKTIWVTNEIIHNPVVNSNLQKLGMSFIPKSENHVKDFSMVQKGDVVVLPAFGASIDEMAYLKNKDVFIVDTTCPWVVKVWNSVEKTKDKGCTAIVHGTYDHEETVATSSFAEKYIVVKDMKEAEIVADYILRGGDKTAFMEKFARRTSRGFDPDVDLVKVGVANQTTMMKGETQLIGKLFERTMIRKYGPQEINNHFLAFNTICDATEHRQDAMYKMISAEYEPPTSELYKELEESQQGEVKDEELLSQKAALAGQALNSKTKEDLTKGVSGEPVQHPTRIDMCLVVGGYNSSNTIHLLEIAHEEGIPGYHIDSFERIGIQGEDEKVGPISNVIQHKPLSTSPAQAVNNEALEVTEGFLSTEGPITIGITSGASTPDNIVERCLERILAVRGTAVPA
eukprot:gnl/MRDRNA2_/MRDRNA2_100840_c0_seq1.p1 gnl/MRDRNA2_/MRDRNA2_100840_c0~~gnl/MRDRNA2_/MRDRNA2_100840_c0_seq1.p1  ORF type:complete len:739 (+),score=133.39 gnl/MRDRNA2_/MRDRNA2_100840_c0_seq1:333-2219(+)